jgi:hypothetical protein
VRGSILVKFASDPKLSSGKHLYGGATPAPDIAGKAVAVELKATNHLFALTFAEGVALNVAVQVVLGHLSFHAEIACGCGPLLEDKHQQLQRQQPPTTQWSAHVCLRCVWLSLVHDESVDSVTRVCFRLLSCILFCCTALRLLCS